MKTSSRSRKSLARFLGRLFSASLIVWTLGAVYVPAYAQVKVDQEPLIIQKPIPPNIVLMLDDSGSMAWDVMPDYGYLSDTSQKALINSDVNGLYYNPNITYDPPLLADGGSYPDADFGNALVNGFDAGSRSVDLSTYNGRYDSSRNYYDDVQYSISVNGSIYNAQSCPSYSSPSSKYPGYCYFKPQDGNPYDFYDSSNGYYYVNRCSDSRDSYNNGKCTPTRSFFTYTVTNSSGGYTRHYIAKTSGDCADVGLSNSVCDESATSRQNVANWFSYYHTRILMAKSGIMNSFAGIDAKFRIGYASLHGNNSVGLGAETVKPVAAFGDGTGTTQKAGLWKWLVSEYASGGTPLRSALDTVGKYYETLPPWQSVNDVTGDTEALACRQSYTILTTDGFWNGNNPKPGNVDGSQGPSQTSPDQPIPYVYSPHLPFSDDQSDTLADVAMKYWVTDLRGDINNEVPTNKADEAFWQHMVTFGLGLGFDPVYYDGGPTIPVDQIQAWSQGDATQAISNFSWPTPTGDSIKNIADLAHAGINGHGGFFSAKSPQAFADGLKSALQRASERVGTGASLSANSTKISNGTFVFQANYFTGSWKGDLKALRIDPDTKELESNPEWNAASALPAAASRKIYTYGPGSGSGPELVPFADPSLLTSTQQSALGATTAEQQDIIDYLRGDATKEEKNAGGIYRSRETALGDIVDSQPIYVGAPDPNQFYNETFTGSDSYITFAGNNDTRAAMVYIAANDGMLHAFDPITGVEKFAYLPDAVIKAGVKKLADPDYGTTAVPHQYFNDGELTVANVYMSSAWHTILVGTTGRGTAKAVYALDVTDPANISLLWERSAGDGMTNSDYIGQITGRPVIAQTDDGAWSVLMGNGYNSTTGVSALLQFDLPDGTLHVHKTGDSTTNNGLAAPIVWLGNSSNGVSTVAYAGDLHGQVWSFDIINPKNGKPTPDSTGTLLFTAKDSGGKVQPITAGMLAGQDPDTGNVWLFFGTGQYLSTDDLSNKSVQTWYGLIVQSLNTPSLVSNLSNGRSALAQRSIIAEVPASPGDPTATPPVLPSLAKRVITPGSLASDITGKSGWYIDLISPLGGIEGERMVTPNQFNGNLLIGNSRIPEATDLCNPSGRGWIMPVKPFTGTNPDTTFFDTNGDGVLDTNDGVTINGTTYVGGGIGYGSITNNPYFIGNYHYVSLQNGKTPGGLNGGSSGGLSRVSWRELSNQ